MVLNGGGRTIKTGRYSFCVEENANLCLYNLKLIDGTVRSLDLGPFNAYVLVALL